MPGPPPAAIFMLLGPQGHGRSLAAHEPSILSRDRKGAVRLRIHVLVIESAFPIGKMKVVLSHAAGSKELAEALARSLAGRGAPATLALDEIVPQGAWLPALERELRDAAAVVLLIEPQAQEERPAWSAVLEASWDDPNKKLIGVLVDGAEAPPFLAGAPAIRIRSDAFDAAALAGDILSLAEPGQAAPLPEEEPEKSAQRERLENIASTALALPPVQRSRELRVLLVCPSDDLARSFADALQKSRSLSVAGRISTYPSASELLAGIARLAPEVVAIDYGSQLQAALDLTRSVAKAEPSRQIFALHNSADPETILNAMRAGSHEFLYPPFTAETLSRIALRINQGSAQASRARNLGTVIAFVGAKAGAGASTLAVNTAGAISESGKQTLLLDLDLQGGTVGFQLQLPEIYSVRDAIARSGSLDETLWRALVHNKSGRLDVLPASHEWGSPAVGPDRIHGLLDSARTAYEVVIADLPAATDYISSAALASCDQAVVASLTDVTSLWLTRNGLAYLDGIGLARNRCSVVLNRASKKDSDLVGEVINKVLDRSVEFVFPDDKPAVEDALLGGKFVSPNTPLGREIRRFAGHLTGVQPQERRPKASFARSLLRWT